MKKKGQKTRGRRLTAANSCLAVLMTLSVAAQKGLARGQIRGDRDENLALTVRAYIYAHIPPNEMTTAERVASKILEKAGSELTWVDCPMTGDPAQLNPACTAPHAPTDIHLNIVPDLAVGPRVGKFAMGLAVATSPPNRGQFASLSIARARNQLLEAPELTLGQLLGHGIAHEIGHLLLGTNSHSDTGLMSAHWNGQELKLAAYMQLVFSEKQAESIRADVRARMGDQYCPADWSARSIVRRASCLNWSCK